MELGEDVPYLQRVQNLSQSLREKRTNFPCVSQYCSTEATVAVEILDWSGVSLGEEREDKNPLTSLFVQKR